MSENINSILVAVDPKDSKDATGAFELAVKRAKQENSKLYIVSVIDYGSANIFQVLDKDAIDAAREQLAKHLEEYREKAEAAGIDNNNIETVAAGGDKPGKVIVEEVIPNVKADLVVIGANKQNKFDKHFGSQASYVAQNSPISVLIYREDRK